MPQLMNAAQGRYPSMMEPFRLEGGCSELRVASELIAPFRKRRRSHTSAARVDASHCCDRVTCPESPDTSASPACPPASTLRSSAASTSLCLSQSVGSSLPAHFCLDQEPRPKNNFKNAERSFWEEKKINNS